MPNYLPNCFLALEGVWEREGEMPPCSGRMTKAHLISQQELKKHPNCRAGLFKPNDERTWVLACMGHHHSFDYARTIRLHRSSIPTATELFAEQHDLLWYLDRYYLEEG